MDYVITARDIVTTTYTLQINEEYIKSLREEWVRQQGTDSGFITLELVYAALRYRKSVDILTRKCPESEYETIGDWICEIVQEDAWTSDGEEIDADLYDAHIELDFSEEDRSTKLEEQLDDWVLTNQVFGKSDLFLQYLINSKRRGAE